MYGLADENQENRTIHNGLSRSFMLGADDCGGDDKVLRIHLGLELINKGASRWIILLVSIAAAAFASKICVERK